MRCRLLGIVLCGGASTRMGTDKASLKDDRGKTFLEIAHDRLAGLVDEVRLSVAADAADSRDRRDEVDIRDAYRCIQDHEPSRSLGPMAGLVASLQAAARDGFDGILVTPVDTPNLTTDDLSRLIECFDCQRPKIICAAGNENESGEGHHFEPLIAVYPTDSQTLIEECLQRGEFGLQRFLHRQDVQRVTLPAEHCQNINTPRDLSS